MPVGRLIFTVNALPAVRPMNFALADGLILGPGQVSLGHVNREESAIGHFHRGRSR